MFFSSSLKFYWIEHEPVHKLTDLVQGWVPSPGQGLTSQLVACCSCELATSFSRVTGGKNFTLNEATLLLRMKELIVQQQNPAVYVQEFLAMSQQPDEGVRHHISLQLLSGLHV